MENNKQGELQGGQELRPVSSNGTTGTWGEGNRGEGVNVEQARADFELARQSSRNSQRSARTQQQHARGQSVSRFNKQSITEAKQMEQGEGGGQEDDGDDFDLGQFIQARMSRAKEEGKSGEKPLGVSWRDVCVKVPGGSGGGVLVKTLPQAIVNTVTTDPIGIFSFLFPTLGKKLAHKQSGGSVNYLIQGHDGILKAGEMLLVLGRPGSGCSTTLRALTASSNANVEQTGTISFGGLCVEEVQKYYRGEVLFSDEDDIHYPTLTVAQTLQFALKNKVPTRSQRLSSESRKDFINTVTDVVLKMFGMSHVRDTIVGDAATRGVSGGERKRVTIGEALIGRSSVVAWDNSTRGLDASTALDYARSLRIMTDLSRRTTMATLYQVSESIFEYFDRVAVIDEGRCIYYGPRIQAREYFHTLGYFSPHRQTTSDFVTAVTDPDQVQYRDGFEKSTPKTAEEREQAWKKSSLYASLLKEIDEYDAKVAQSEKEEAEQLRQVTTSEKNSGVKHTSPYTVSFWEQVKACIWRQLLIRWGSRVDMQIKLFTIVSISFVIGALFYGEAYDSTGIFTRGGVILFLCLFNGWLQLSEAFEAVAGRPMLARHRQFAFHRPSAVVIARAIVDIPLLLVQCFISVLIIWGLAGLRRTAGSFFLYLVYVFLSAYNLTALYRMIAALSGGFNEAIRFSVLALNIIIIFVGYVIRRPQMNWMVWLNYVNGISYAFEGMLALEVAYDIPCAPGQIIPFGEARDVTFQTCALTGSQPGSISVTAANYLETTFKYKRSTIAYNWAVLIAFTILYLIPTILASEVIDWTGSGGGVTVFARTKAAKEKLLQKKKKGNDGRGPRVDDVEAGGAKKERRDSAALVEQDDASGDACTTRANSMNGNNNNTNEKEEQQQQQQLGGQVRQWKTVSKEELDTRAIFTWKDVNLTLPTGRKLLQHVDGWVKPGEMTALMGASGAGKTTLMSALSQRGVAGIVNGEIYVDGKPLDRGFQKGTGLVLQGDVHLATQTVREALEFSAILRQPSNVSREEKLKTVEHVLDTLELRSLQDAVIGVPGAGLGVERRKRVTIGVELAARPDLLLFLDEPTSGLDSAGAASIVRLLRRLAQEGQAILCTIHQPSALLFEGFDNVLLLKPGGETAYFGQIGKTHGKGSEQIRQYFESNGAPPCPAEENAAEYILEVVSGSKGKSHDWAEVWRASDESRAIRAEVDRIVEERKQRPASDDPRAHTEYSANAMTQLKEVTKRQFVDVWRDSSFSYGVLFSNMVVGLVAGGAFSHLGTSPTFLQDRVFIVFLILLNVPAVVNSVLSKFFTLRMLYEVRERESKVYAWWALVTSFIVTAAPLAFVCSIIYFLPSFYIPFHTFSSSGAGYFYLMIFTMQCWMFLFAFLVSFHLSFSSLIIQIHHKILTLTDSVSFFSSFSFSLSSLFSLPPLVPHQSLHQICFHSSCQSLPLCLVSLFLKKVCQHFTDISSIMQIQSLTLFEVKSPVSCMV